MQQEELSLMCACSHPRIVQLYAAFHDTSVPRLYLVMPRFERNLGHAIAQAPGGLEEWVIWWVLGQLLAALRYLHSPQTRKNPLPNRIIHRDIKPANILVRDEWSVALTDFGVSRTLFGDSCASTRIGTVQYMAPEQIDGREYTERVDIWALGTTLFEMTSGKRLFPLPVEDVRRAQNEGVSVLLLILKCSEKLRGLLESMLQLEADKRISTEQLCCDPLVGPLVALADQPCEKQTVSAIHATIASAILGSNCCASERFFSFELNGDADPYGRTPLMLQVITREEPHGLWGDSPWIRMVTPLGVTALMLATLYRNEEAVRGLLPYEAGMRDNAGCTALVYAIHANFVEAVELLVPQEVLLYDNLANTPLMKAASLGNGDIVCRLAQVPGLVGSHNAKHWTALMLAAGHNFVACVPPLLEEAGLHDKMDETALMKAVRAGAVDAVDLLIPVEKGCSRGDGKTALMIAAELGNSIIVKKLCSIEGRRAMRDGRTALMFAAKKNHVSVISELYEEAGMRDSMGRTALAYARENGSEEAIQQLKGFPGEE
ncbi:Kinase, NEK [Giardia muris]|uniref:Kinase, NEK n=1 Tax=Giardia muris TaxID=5742 RepID=A0A4Z1T929_GIAMU|nr:Kinase, NEK [Giardia muris]|eukprot:TNJ29657.1 Kinase, NEK [Giardia muris]